MVDWVLDALQAEMIKECLAKVHGVSYVFATITDNLRTYSLLAEGSG
jgi:hypothetical protein